MKKTNLTFDLISDLHVESWPNVFDWSSKSTSLLCVVAGDISKDRDLLIQTLTHLGDCYRMVLYIDGNDEHYNYFDNITDSYDLLIENVSDLPNVVYLRNNVVITEGVAFVGANGWWTYDFNPDIDYAEAKEWFQMQSDANMSSVTDIEKEALQDYAYLTNTIKKLQTYPEVNQIVIVTHTVPSYEFIEHDVFFNCDYEQNIAGNSFIRGIIAADTEHKISTWCFGHYHGSVDRSGHGIRYVNNCRGKGNSDKNTKIYNPLQIKITG